MQDPYRKSIILVDFDNIFMTLWQLDRETALKFGNDPAAWLAGLSKQFPRGVARRWLVARCYLTPNGWVTFPDGEKLYLSRFRTPLVGAGFDVVDCPTMARGKNAADIRLVIDALDLLGAEARYDEFAIASGDSDFAPLLQRIRAQDRRSVVIAPGQVSRAYVALADIVLGYEAIETLLRGDEPPRAATSGTGDLVPDAAQAAFAVFIGARYAAAGGPLNFSALSQQASSECAGARPSNWFGAGSFKAAVARLDLPNAAFSQYHLWDEVRHAPPADAHQQGEDMPEAIEMLFRAFDVPRIGRGLWPEMFRTIATYAATQTFNLSESSRWSRDTMAEQGKPVARPALNYVIKGTQLGGAPLDRDPPPDAAEIAASFRDSLIDRARGNGMIVDGADEAELTAWFGLDDLALQDEPSN